MSTPPPLLALENLTKGYRLDRPAVLSNLQLRLGSGEYLAIMGESGVGKSTLLNLIAGLDRPDSGHVRIAGVDLYALDDDARTRLRRRDMGFVFQAFHVMPYLTVEQNVALPLELLSVGASERAQRTAQILEAVGIGALARRYPRELSGGELQRIAIARALVHRPRLVLADEPTGNLDQRSAALVLALLREQLRSGGASAILITHSRAAAETADRILILADGTLASEGPWASKGAQTAGGASQA